MAWRGSVCVVRLPSLTPTTTAATTTTAAVSVVVGGERVVLGLGLRSFGTASRGAPLPSLARSSLSAAAPPPPPPPRSLFTSSSSSSSSSSATSAPFFTLLSSSSAARGLASSSAPTPSAALLGGRGGRALWGGGLEGVALTAVSGGGEGMVMARASARTAFARSNVSVPLVNWGIVQRMSYSSSSSSSTTDKDKDKGAVAASAKDGEAQPSRLTRLWVAIKKEAIHYYHGFRLFGSDVRVAASIFGRKLSGKELTRRERQHLVRTAADCFRMIPLLIVIVVPFMEFALPFMLYLFPNMLPSQFQDNLKKEEATKKELKVRLEMAKFLQDTVHELYTASSQAPKVDTAAFKDFMQRVRSGSPVTNEEIRKFSSLFDDNFTIDHVDRPQLLGMARFLNISHIGTNAVLRYNLRAAFAKIAKDDAQIQAEGVKSLNYEELQQACTERGMRSLGLPKETLELQLQQWLDLSLGSKVPKAMLLLSRAFLITATPEEAISKTLSGFSALQVEEAVTAAQAIVGDNNREKVAAVKKEVSLMAAEVRAAETVAAKVAEKKLEDQLEGLESVVHVLGTKELLAKEKADLVELKKFEELEKGAPMDKVAKKLDRQVDAIIGKLETKINSVDSALQSKIPTIDADNDGVISEEELFVAVGVMKVPLTRAETAELWRKIDRDKDGKVTLQEVHAYLHRKVAEFDAKVEAEVESGVKQTAEKQIDGSK